MKKIFSFLIRHKFITAIFILALATGGYYSFKAVTNKPQEAHYVLAKASKGNIISTISGTGQIAATNQLDVKAKASGNITSLVIKEGDTVKSGQLLATIDSTTALKAVRDARTNLETAQLSLKDLTSPVDELTLLQSQNALINAENGKTSSRDNLNKAYADAQNAIASAFLDFPNIVSGIKNALYGYDISKQQSNLDYLADSAKVYDLSADLFRDSAAKDYTAARAAYDANFLDYKNSGRSSDTAATTALLNETYATSQLISQAVLSANNLVQFYEDRLTEHGIAPIAAANTLLSNLNGFTSKINSLLSSLLGYTQSIKNYTQSISDADRTIAEKTASLAKTQAGPSDSDLRNAQINIASKQNALSDANTALADYYIRAPFDGVIASLAVKKGDTVSNGTSAATIITKQLSSSITLNEIDAVKVKVGNKATVTFDAIDGLSITGTVSEIDALGAVSQGVVTYGSQIVFDTQDDRVRPGMSITASIIIDSRQNVLIVPSSAIKTANEISYVLVPSETVADLGNSRTGVTLSAAPIQKIIEVSLSDGTNTEVVSGLTEDEVFVVKTIAATSATTSSATSATQSRSILQTGGGAVRTGGGFAPTGH